MNRIFYRWSAYFVLTGALVLAAGYLLRTDIDKKYIDEFASTQGLVSSIMVAAGSLLFLFGLPGLLASRNLYASKSGIIASAFGFTGIAAFHLGTIALYFVAPVLVTQNAATRALMYSDEPPFPRFALFWAMSLLLQVIGLVWIGIRMWKDDSGHRWNAMLLVTGALVFVLAPMIYFPLIKPANTMVMAGFAMWAFTILRSRLPAEDTEALG